MAGSLSETARLTSRAALQLLSQQFVKSIEVPVSRGKWYLMLDAQRCDPEVVLRNWLALHLQTEPEPGINSSRCSGDIQDTTSRKQPFDLGQVLGGPSGVQSAVPQFSDNRNWQEELCDGPGKKGRGRDRQEPR